jgi:hypothetical protein
MFDDHEFWICAILGGFGRQTKSAKFDLREKEKLSRTWIINNREKDKIHTWKYFLQASICEDDK